MVFSTLKAYLLETLNANTSLNVYNRVPPLNAEFPYMVYTLKNAFNLVLDRQDLTLELNYWDNNNSSLTNVLPASESVKSALHKYYRSESEGFFRSYLDFEDPDVPTEKPEIVRITQRFNIINYPSN